MYNKKAERVETGKFTDVKQDAWYSEAINKFTHQGFVTGYADGSFKPNHSITREEAFVMPYRILLCRQKVVSSQ